MFDRMRKMAGRDTDKGFTLVELLVVVVILVALAAIAVPIFLNQTKKANDGAAVSSVSSVASAVSNAASTGGTIAVASNTLTATDGAGGTTTLNVPSGMTVKSGGTLVAGTAVSPGSWCVNYAFSGGTASNAYQASTMNTPSIVALASVPAGC